MKLKDREALRFWEEYRNSILKSTTIDIHESFTDKEKRIASLKKDFEAFCKYYFPNYFMSEFAAFHKRFAKKVINNKRIYITRAWSRAHAKSVEAGIMLPLFLKFTDELKNMLCVSYNQTNAESLLLPLQIQLESNQRLINDFGTQIGFGAPNTWGCKFLSSDSSSVNSCSALPSIGKSAILCPSIPY